MRPNLKGRVATKTTCFWEGGNLR